MRALILIAAIANALLFAAWWREWTPWADNPREPQRLERQLQADRLPLVPITPPAAPSAAPSQQPGEASGLNAPLKDVGPPQTTLTADSPTSEPVAPGAPAGNVPQDGAARTESAPPADNKP